MRREKALKAAGEGDAQALASWIKSGADLDALGLQGGCALLEAASAGQALCVKMLLEAGANPNAGHAHSGDTPAQWAAKHEDPECLRLLRDAGADLSLGDDDEESYGSMAPALEAALRGHWRTLSICEGPALARKSRTGATVAITAVMAPSDKLGLACLQVLAKAGEVDWNARMDNGWTAAFAAVEAGNGACLEFLANAGADLDLKCAGAINGWSLSAPIHNAARQGRTDLVGILARHGARLDEPGAAGLTAREWALKSGSADCVAAIDAELEKRELSISVPGAPSARRSRM